MKAKTRQSRHAWIRAGLDVLRDEGIERVRVEPLAERLGVTKGSFYWHFDSREALLEAMLEAWEEVGTEAIIRDVAGPTQGEPRERLRALWRRTLADSEEDLRTELAIRELARRDESVRVRVERVDARRMRFLRRHFRAMGLGATDAEARSLSMYSLLVGNYFIQATHGRTSRARVLDRAIDDLLR